MRLDAFLIATVLFSTLSACGAGDETDEKKNIAGGAGGTEKSATTTVDQDTDLLLSDEQLAGDNIASTVDDAISDLIEGSESKDASSGGFSLADSEKTAKVTRYRACKLDETGQKAVVSVKRGIERERSFSKFNRTGSLVLKMLAEKTRTWSKEGGAMACSANGKHAEIARANLKGVTLEATFKREHLHQSSFQNTKKGTSTSQSRKSNASGKRTIKWTDVKTEGTNLVLTKTVQSEASRSFESTNKKGETKSFVTSVKTADDAPLVIVVTRESASDKLVSRLIVSGKKIATQKSGGRIETVFTNVKYLPSDGCYPTSGKVEGSIFAKDATTAAATFVVEFSGDTKSIVLTKSDGTVVESEYVADGCDIEGQEVEETPGTTQDMGSADQVTMKI